MKRAQHSEEQYLSLHKNTPLFSTMTTWILEGHWEHPVLVFPSLTVSIVPSCYSPLSLMQGYPLLHHMTSWAPASTLQNRFFQDALTCVLILASSEGSNTGINFTAAKCWDYIPEIPSVVMCLIVRTRAHLLGGLRLNLIPKPTPGSKKPSNPSGVFSFLSLHPFPPLAPPSHCRCLHQTST